MRGGRVFFVFLVFFVFFSGSLGMELCSKIRTKLRWLQKYPQFVWSASMFLILKNALTGTTFQSQSHSRAVRVELTDTHNNTHARSHIHTCTNKTDLDGQSFLQTFLAAFPWPSLLHLTLPLCEALVWGERQDLALLLFFHQVFNNLLDWTETVFPMFYFSSAL